MFSLLKSSRTGLVCCKIDADSYSRRGPDGRLKLRLNDNASVTGRAFEDFFARKNLRMGRCFAIAADEHNAHRIQHLDRLADDRDIVAVVDVER